jgi:Na+-transporting NADH:ubiquinone oxidoreductase subunit NqrD
MGFKSFIESFVVEAFHEDMRMIYSLFMLANLEVIFAMFLLCYAQRLSYSIL